MIQDNIFYITYGDGKRGKLQINLLQFLPCSKTDFKKLLSAVDLSADSISLADELNEYIKHQLKCCRDIADNKTGTAKETAQKDCRKWIALNETLVKQYGCKAFTDDPAAEKVKFKRSIVYAFKNDNNKPAAVPMIDGYIFCIAGIDFSAYRNDKKDSWHILETRSGLQACICTSRSAIAETVNAIIDKINAARETETYKRQLEHFTSLVNDDGIILPYVMQPNNPVNDENDHVISKRDYCTKTENQPAAQPENMETETAQPEDAQPEKKDADNTITLERENVYTPIPAANIAALLPVSIAADIAYKSVLAQYDHKQIVETDNVSLHKMFISGGLLNGYIDRYNTACIAMEDIYNITFYIRQPENYTAAELYTALKRDDMFTADLKNKFKRGFITYAEFTRDIVTWNENCIRQEREAAVNSTVDFCGKKIFIADLLVKFSSVYDYLYNNRNDHPHYRLAMDEFDHGEKNLYENVVTMFNKARMDFISSDREAAAFIIALYDLSRLAIPGTNGSTEKKAVKNDPLPETLPEKNDHPVLVKTRKATAKKIRRSSVTREFNCYQYDREADEFMPVWRYTVSNGGYCFSVHYDQDLYEKKNHIRIGDPANGCVILTKDNIEKLNCMESLEAQNINRAYDRGFITEDERIQALYRLHMKEYAAERAAQEAAEKEKNQRDYKIIDVAVKDKIINAYMHNNITADEMKKLLEKAYAAAQDLQQKEKAPAVGSNAETAVEHAEKPVNEKSTATNTFTSNTVETPTSGLKPVSGSVSDTYGSAAQEKHLSYQHKKQHSTFSVQPEYIDTS